jgi:hypothetical protein
MFSVLYLFVTCLLIPPRVYDVDRGGWLASLPGPYTPGKEPPVSVGQEAG